MLTILLVEDHDLLLLALSDLLEMQGYAVFKALDGLEAWEMLQYYMVDLVLTNYEMPHLNGLDLLKLLRADQRYATLPVIVFTACDAEAMFMAHGATAFILKPFAAPTFLEVVNRVVSDSAV